MKKAKRSSPRDAPENKSGADVLNVRKAVRFASKGKGSASLVRETRGGKGKKGKR